MNPMNILQPTRYDLQSNPIPDPLSPPSPGHRPEEPQHPDAPPDGHPV
ncbi:MAG: hypothetical protein CBCREVIR_0757 [Candidatus Burkholderia crenata]|nr:MAG: hypothetical protein CBCREVIR_0757 [Candidatus Burkholderia crenata]